jgi:hypothetical protein
VPVLPEVFVAVLKKVKAPVVILSVMEIAFVPFSRSELIGAVAFALPLDVMTSKSVSVREYERTETMPFPVLESSDVFSAICIVYGAESG